MRTHRENRRRDGGGGAEDSRALTLARSAGSAPQSLLTRPHGAGAPSRDGACAGQGLRGHPRAHTLLPPLELPAVPFTVTMLLMQVMARAESAGLRTQRRVWQPPLTATSQLRGPGASPFLLQASTSSPGC